MPAFATYLHAETGMLSRPAEQIEFVGQSYPYFVQVREALAQALAGYPTLPPRQAPYEEYASVHDADYLRKLRLMAEGQTLEEPPRLSLECQGLEHTLPGYGYGLGGMYEAIDQMRRGVLERAYCMASGGHHAYADWGHGYCILNPMAAAVRYAQRQGFERVLILDWDLHHGDGTQSIFANDPSVYHISIHSMLDLYMAKTGGLQAGTTVAAQEVGQHNIPVLHQRFNRSTLEKLGLSGEFYRGRESLSAVATALQRPPWEPDLICIFSGYDAHRDDQGGGITDWDDDDYRRLTRLVLERARRAGCPVLSAHGGGYTLPVVISAACAHVEVLAGYRA